MSFYHKLGKIPQKRHTQFRKTDGSLYREELISSLGFDGIYTNAYHINSPARIEGIEEDDYIFIIQDWIESSLRPFHFRTAKFHPDMNYVTGRKPLMFNENVILSICCPDKKMDYFYKNALCDELVFVHEGEGTLQTNLGFLDFKKGDYIVIPRGTIFNMVHKTQCRFLVFESFGPITPPARYRNEFGQLMEHSPYCERDIRVPEDLVTIEEKGDFEVKVKKGERMVSIHYKFHPFDIIGYDGYYYPWIFNINDFMPITGKIHQPPPVHQTFDGPGFVVCSFVSRMLDYHPLSIPVPYNHSNLDCDEMIYYADGSFTSRKGIEVGSISLHPGGIPHGPHPGTVEEAIGKKETIETAVMMDTFKPLKLTHWAKEINDEKYYLSWKE